MNTRSSMCVGGPWDGRTVAHTSPSLHVAVRGRTQYVTEIIQPVSMYTQDVYTYVPVFGCNVLVHESLYNTGPDWMKELMHKLLAGYKSVSYEN